MRKILIAVTALLTMAAASSQARVVKETVEYELAGKKYEGYLAYDDAVKGRRPGVLIVHQWMGLTDNERMRAEMLARMGYTAFALDVYGKGVRPADTAEAAQEAGKYYGDRALFRKRLTAGLELLRGRDDVDRWRVAAIGYCFGGGGALELARSGVDIAGVVSFHGSLNTPDPADAKNIKAKVLVCHGAADPHVKSDEVRDFVDEMEAAAVDYQLIMYAGAVHAFTQKGAGNDPSRGAAYNAAADRRSWRHMQEFFGELFGD
jgi:dienelactone hydrolase